MRLVFAGTPQEALPSLEALLASEHEVVAAVTRPDAPAGRGRSPAPSPVARRADQAGIETVKPESARDPGFARRLRELAPDVCPIVAYGALLPSEVLAIPRHGWINLHFSVLPAWRGAAPVQHTVLHGDEVAGASTFQVDESMDTGPIYGVVTERVDPTDTSGDLLARLADSGAKLLVRTLDGIGTGKLHPRAQPQEGASYAPKLGPQDARVDWSQPAAAVDRLIRACTPAPGAWTEFRGQRLKLGPVRPAPEDAVDDGGGVLEPGRLHVQRGRVLAGTGTDPVELGEVQPEGKRSMPAADWARGLRLSASDRLG